MPLDILLDENNDLLIENGDFVIGESTLQHQRLLLFCNKGEFKEFPTRCVGILRFIETHDTQGLAREIDVDYSKDGMQVEEIKIELPNLNIKANYNE